MLKLKIRNLYYFFNAVKSLVTMLYKKIIFKNSIFLKNVIALCRAVFHGEFRTVSCVRMQQKLKRLEVNVWSKLTVYRITMSAPGTPDVTRTKTNPAQSTPMMSLPRKYTQCRNRTRLPKKVAILSLNVPKTAHWQKSKTN